MEQKDIRFYKLNKSKRYGVEGTNLRVGEAILLWVVLAFFVSVIIVLIAVNIDVLFLNAGITVAVFLLIVILSVIIAVACAKYVPIIKRRKHARKILKNCTLTDGTVIDINKQKMWHHGSHPSTNYSYYRVRLKYSFHDLNGVLRYGEHTGSYGEVPFCLGQNLMIAFNDTGSVIMNKFALSDGADEFEKAEAEREYADFTGLSGDLIKIDITKPVYLADYSWSLFHKTCKRKKRLKQILEDYPRFAAGRLFIKKSTYRYNAGNNKYYCYISENGKKHVEECAGLCNFKDGNEVVVAYGGGVSEIVLNYTLKKTFPKPRRKKSD